MGQTTSAGPTCLRKVPARVFERDGRLLLSTGYPTWSMATHLLASRCAGAARVARPIDETCGACHRTRDMCLGCILGACTIGLTYGSGQLIAWIANLRREADMKRVMDGDAASAKTEPAPAITVPAR